jgi:hypothetical protein
MHSAIRRGRLTRVRPSGARCGASQVGRYLWSATRRPPQSVRPKYSGVSISIAAVVFDLADVLFEFGGLASVSRFSRGRVGAVEFAALWRSHAADRLYRGLCTHDLLPAHRAARTHPAIALRGE